MIVLKRVDLCAAKDPKCGAEPVEPHTCPYAEEIKGDVTTLCRCCEACTTECARDI